MRTGSPAAMGWPPSSASRVAVRMKLTTGDVHRSISSTADGTSDRSHRRRSHSAERSASATTPPDTMLRVVHLGLECETLLLGPVGRIGDDGLRPLVEAAPLLVGHAEQRADDVQGE